MDMVFPGPPTTGIRRLPSDQHEELSLRSRANALSATSHAVHQDVMAVMHMGLLGATVTCVAGLGNEPSFAASFA
eukprot:1100449-Amphidinium_carterae.1